MPSNKKKKSVLKPSNSDSDFSSSSPPSNEQLLWSLLDEASAKFPSLISRSAFIGNVVDDTAVSDRSSTIWLSESAMVSSSIAPGSLVSVSLLCSSAVGSGCFPLSSISYECARLELSDNLAGNFFALATVFPSCKVVLRRNGVRLSSNLSHTLGSPLSGKIIFVYPLPTTTEHDGNIINLSNSSCCISLENCKDLYLSPVVCLKGGGKLELEDSSREISSPRTPSISESKVRSTQSSYTSNFKESTSKTTTYLSNNVLLDMEDVLRDDSSKKLLETFTGSWLNSRRLLPGNLVVVPVLSRLCVFQVVGGSKRLLLPNGEPIRNIKNYYDTPPDQDIGKKKVCAFVLDWGTKIHFLFPPESPPMVVERSLAAHPYHHGQGGSGVVVNASKLGGLSKEFAVLRDIIISSATVASLGLRPTKGVLLHGPPGTGKTTLARACAHDAGVNMFSVNGPEIISQYHGETEKALHDVFDNASKSPPALVFIDELDVIAPSRKDGGDELSQRMVATLLNLMDGISRTDGVIVIAATNRPDSIEPALRRPGRLDREIEIGVPSPRQRYEILLALVSEMEHSLSDEDIQNIAMATHGFVGADLAALCNEAALVCLRQYVKSNIRHGDSDLEAAAFSCTQISPDLKKDVIEVNGTCVLKDSLKVTLDDFEKARVRIRPSAMREVILEIPKVGWEDVGGQTEVKMQLMEAVEWPQKHKDAFERIGTRAPTGILLFGPPGCSKTLLARAVASEAGLNFLAVKGPELFSKWVGESEKAVRSLFEKARANAPSIIFFDEIDGLAVIRGKESGGGVSVGDRVISQLLVELDGLKQRGSVTVIGATNRPDKIDSALLRPGRFDRLLYVGPPNKKDREDIFRVHLNRMPCGGDVCISELSLLTQGCTGADVSLICREAAIAAIEENLSATEIGMKHLKVGIEKVEPSDDVGLYEKLSAAMFQRLVLSTETCSSKPSRIAL